MATWAEYNPTERDRLLDHVREGKVSPQQAELIASARGLGPLACRPSADEFNPLGEVWWTLPMAIAWIMWREPGKVREQFDVYRKECWSWVSRPWRTFGGKLLDGHVLLQERSAQLLPLSISAGGLLSSMFPDGRLVEFDSATRELWHALQDQRIDGYGQSPAAGRQAPIPAHEWANLHWHERDDEEPVYLAQHSRGRDYERIRLRSRDLIDLWPPCWRSSMRMPDIVAPTGTGDMSLFDAAAWIATRGAEIPVGQVEAVEWARSFAALLDQIRSGGATVTGFRAGEREEIKPAQFAGVILEHPLGEMHDGLPKREDIYLRCFPQIGEGHWQGKAGNSLGPRMGSGWSALLIPMREVARTWPFALSLPDREPVPGHTGAPGRPSSMSLVTAKFRERCESSAAKPKLAEEAAELSNWLTASHPEWPQLKPKTISNSIRGEFRRRFGAARN